MSAVEEIRELSDVALYHLCQEYGMQARVWKRKFAGLLPEALRRNLHRQKGFAGIHEFAAKLGSMSRASVDRVLRLHDRLQDKPILLDQLLSGEMGWSKLESVSYIAKPETDEMWARKVEKLPVVGLKEEVRNERRRLTAREDNFMVTPDVGCDFAMNITDAQVRNHTFPSFPVSTELELEFNEFKMQLEKEKKAAVTHGEVLGELLKRAKKGEASQTLSNRQVMLERCYDCVRKSQLETEAAMAQINRTPSRHIPVEVRRVVIARHEGKCAWPGIAQYFGGSMEQKICIRAIHPLHHLKPFSLYKSHDPDILVPLCEHHHSLIHAHDEYVQKFRREIMV